VSVYTIGHSNLSLDDFLDRLRSFAIELVADVRHYPGSRAHPHFGKARLAASLREAGIDYRHFVGLGGRRHPLPDSPNTGWEVEAFRAYADYALTPTFALALEELIDACRTKRTAILCAEAVPWRCHRRIVTDHLLVRGIEVVHIVGPGRGERATLTPFAQVLPDGRIVYPGEGASIAPT